MKKLNTGEFIIKANLKHNNQYDYSICNYVDTFTKVKIICKRHGIFEQQPSNHLFGQGCPMCGEINRRKNRKSNIENFINKAHIIHNNKYDYSLVNYIDVKSLVVIICPIHGEFKQIVNSHLNGKGCPVCAIKSRSDIRKKTNEDFINESLRIHNGKYDYSLVNYINARHKVKIICPSHGIFEQKPDNHLSGNGCPFCNESKGEIKISRILDKLNINYIRQKTFEGCIGKKRKLPFDFYLPEKNLIIEYDGKQHFEIIEVFGGNNAFNETQLNDKIKNNYLLKNGIKLLRISYKNFNDIENIVKLNV